jgi:hypothetical protein
VNYKGFVSECQAKLQMPAGSFRPRRKLIREVGVRECLRKMTLLIISTWLQPGEQVFFLSSKPLKRFPVGVGRDDHLAEARC